MDCLQKNGVEIGFFGVFFLDCLEKGCGDWVFWTDFLKGCRDLWIDLKKGCRDWFCGLP